MKLCHGLLGLLSLSCLYSCENFPPLGGFSAFEKAHKKISACACPSKKGGLDREKFNLISLFSELQTLKHFDLALPSQENVLFDAKLNEGSVILESATDISKTTKIEFEKLQISTYEFDQPETPSSSGRIIDAILEHVQGLYPDQEILEDKIQENLAMVFLDDLHYTFELDSHTASDTILKIKGTFLDGDARLTQSAKDSIYEYHLKHQDTPLWLYHKWGERRFFPMDVEGDKGLLIQEDTLKRFQKVIKEDTSDKLRPKTLDTLVNIRKRNSFLFNLGLPENNVLNQNSDALKEELSEPAKIDSITQGVKGKIEASRLYLWQELNNKYTTLYLCPFELRIHCFKDLDREPFEEAQYHQTVWLRIVE